MEKGERIQFDTLFAQIKASIKSERERLIAQRAAQLKKEQETLSKAITDASAAGKSSISVGRLSDEAKTALEKHCTIKPTMGYNPSTHDDMVIGFEISWT